MVLLESLRVLTNGTHMLMNVIWWSCSLISVPHPIPNAKESGMCPIQMVGPINTSNLWSSYIGSMSLSLVCPSNIQCACWYDCHLLHVSVVQFHEPNYVIIMIIFCLFCWKFSTKNSYSNFNYLNIFTAQFLCHIYCGN
jgi:hypothetical protein